MLSVTKTWRDLPAAHRQPNHDGHCRLVHGHNWAFDITFSCEKLDENGFVVDVGKLGEIKSFLTDLFDHTLLINQSDPLLPAFQEMERNGIVNLRVVPNCGMEGLAEHVSLQIQLLLYKEKKWVDRKLEVREVVCWEDSKNRATIRL